jgi:hypothetical protein
MNALESSFDTWQNEYQKGECGACEALRTKVTDWTVEL